MKQWLRNLYRKLFRRSPPDKDICGSWRTLSTRKRIQFLKKVDKGLKKMVSEEDRY